MGDMGDIYNEWKAFKAEAKRDRHDAAQAVFFDAWQGPPMPGWVKHTPYHWSRDLQGDRLDYWPSTGKWRWKNQGFHGTPYDTANFIAKREDAQCTARAVKPQCPADLARMIKQADGVE